MFLWKSSSHKIFHHVIKLSKLSLIDRFQFLSSSLDGLVRNLYQDGFKYLIQEFDNNILDLLKKKDFILMNAWTILKSFLKNYLAKQSFIVS